MRKTTKGAIAAGAAAVLLLGGAGTLAYWNDTATVDGGQVSTGHLNLEPAGAAGAWTDVTNGGSAPISDISTFNLVPGDTLQYSRDFTIEAEGDNLVADVSAALPDSQSPEVAQWVDVSVSLQGPDGGPLPAQITDAQDGDTVTVQAEVAFDPDTPGKDENGGTNAADDDTVDLSGLQIRLEQVQGSAGGN